MVRQLKNAKWWFFGIFADPLKMSDGHFCPMLCFSSISSISSTIFTK
jgi:hypothetical protein